MKIKAAFQHRVVSALRPLFHLFLQTYGHTFSYYMFKSRVKKQLKLATSVSANIMHRKSTNKNVFFA